MWPGMGLPWGPKELLPAVSSGPDLADLICFSACHALSLCQPVSGV